MLKLVNLIALVIVVLVSGCAARGQVATNGRERIVYRHDIAPPGSESVGQVGQEVQQPMPGLPSSPVGVVTYETPLQPAVSGYEVYVENKTWGEGMVYVAVEAANDVAAHLRPCNGRAAGWIPMGTLEGDVVGLIRPGFKVCLAVNPSVCPPQGRTCRFRVKAVEYAFSTPTRREESRGIFEGRFPHRSNTDPNYIGIGNRF